MRVEGMQTNQVFPVSNNTSGQGSRETKRPSEEPLQIEQAQRSKEYTKEELAKAVEKANKSFEPFDRSFEISVHEKLNVFMVKVINKSNGEVIREIPSKKLMDMVANMLELAGILIDTKG